jgi:Holliday junction resolvase RusA-like endonuclease
MSDVLVFNVNGMPGAQGSKKGFAVRKGGVPTGKVAMRESSAKVAPWRSDVKAAAEHATGAVGHFDPWTAYAGPVHVSLTFRFARPKAHYRTGRNAHLLRDNAPEYPIGRNLGDVDKLERSTFDALTAAGVIVDDSLIVRVIADKVWCDPGETPGATILVRPMVRPAQAVA